MPSVYILYNLHPCLPEVGSAGRDATVGFFFGNCGIFNFVSAHAQRAPRERSMLPKIEFKVTFIKIKFKFLVV